MEPGVGKFITGTIGRPLRWIDFPMRFHDRHFKIDSPYARAEITDQFLKSLQLLTSRMIMVEIADQTNPKRNVIQIIAVNMAAIDLPPPTIPDFDLSIP